MSYLHMHIDAMKFRDKQCWVLQYISIFSIQSSPRSISASVLTRHIRIVFFLVSKGVIFDAFFNLFESELTNIFHYWVIYLSCRGPNIGSVYHLITALIDINSYFFGCIGPCIVNGHRVVGIFISEI